MVYSARQLSFAQLRSRVIAATRRRIQNGEFTERGLARIAGVSQPHLHNVLKGVRDLTPDVGDALLMALDVGILDLIDSEELAHAVESSQAATSGSRIIPVLRGRIGPGFPIPDHRQPGGYRPLPSGLSIRARRPVVAILAPDPFLLTVFPGAKAAVLDLDDIMRLRPEFPNWYVIRHSCGGLIRQVRLQNGQLEILGQIHLVDEPVKRDLPLGSTSLLHVVRGRILWIGDNLEWPLSDSAELPSF